MNLIDAIKSGKPFRRPYFPIGQWYSYIGSSVIMYRSDGNHYAPDKIDILANDWEIQEQAVTITRSQFWDAAIAVGIIDRVDNGMIHFSGSKDKASCLQQLAHKLGLE